MSIIIRAGWKRNKLRLANSLGSHETNGIALERLHRRTKIPVSRTIITMLCRFLNELDTDIPY